MSERHDTEVMPPPGGRVVSGADHPGTAGMDTGEVDGGSVGWVVVVVGGVVVVGVTNRGWMAWRTTAAGRLAPLQAATRTDSTAHAQTAEVRLRLTLSPLPMIAPTPSPATTTRFRTIKGTERGGAIQARPLAAVQSVSRR